jgi:hypothetical protein
MLPESGPVCFMCGCSGVLLTQKHEIISLSAQGSCLLHCCVARFGGGGPGC